MTDTLTKPVVQVLSRRPEHPDLRAVREAVKTGADLEAVQKLASRRRSNPIWPFEYEALDNIAGASDLDHVRSVLDAVWYNETYLFPFRPGDRVKAVKTTSGFKAGQVYEVDTCYDGPSGCGGTTYVRIRDHGTPLADGTGAGNSPNLFVKADYWDAIFEARAGLGELKRASSGDHWVRATGVVHSTRYLDSDLVRELMIMGVLRSKDIGQDNIMVLVETHWLVKKVGADLAPRDLVEQALRRVLADPDNVSRSNDPAIDTFTPRASRYNMRRVTEALALELGINIGVPAAPGENDGED